MEVSSGHQLFVFLICVLAGIISSVFFDCLRCLRKVHSPGRVLLIFEDLVFFLFISFVVIYAGFRFNDGRIRYYQLLGMIFGMLVYSLLMSRLVVRIIEFTGRMIYRYVIKNLQKIISFFRRIFLNIYKKIKSRINLIRKKTEIGKNIIKRLKKRLKML